MDEQKKFLETAETEYGWYYPMLKVMLLTGMRISEVGGLCWSDIDYDNDVIHIRRALFSQYEYGKKKLHFTTTKTINSVRDIPMMEDCKKMLKLQKKNQNKIKKELGKRYRSENEEGLSDLVFTSSMGSAATRYNVAPIINKIVKSINLREDYESVKENRKPIYMEQVSPHALRSLPVSLVRRKCNTIIRADMSFHSKKCIRRKKEMCKVIAIANQKGGVGKNTTTAAPTTVAPTTEVPTTVAPTTEPPTTMAPTTQSKTSTVAIGEGSDVGKVNRKILNCKNDKDLAGSTFGKLCVKVKKSKKKAISLTWKKIQVAKTYVIYGAKCGTSYKKIATVHRKTFTNKKLKKGTYYKYMVVALNEKGKVVAISKLIHVATKGGKVGNCKKLKVNKSKVNLKQGRKFKLKVKQIAKSKKVKLKKHRKTAFESDNQDVAVVSKKGVITAKKKGKCSVYVYAQNGVYKQVKVTVK
ncbi:tyrosine-type recombinase/integrase [Eubacterium sp. AF34-35BH]|uniref:tyrosine-type recombinase/integrase n=1 Tax=Eubacterium sp. AF34-35BH TaxID=2293107 RepID=UPI000E4D23DA|nr:tyrosine-type recombinase/integrase [Eubacterium sp. AF34-35BH]RHP19369.1 hypothetical protein DWZ69_11585 [Eubacterium sp. AF34-35BH]